jgi:hypothetical protein
MFCVNFQHGVVIKAQFVAAQNGTFFITKQLSLWAS